MSAKGRGEHSGGLHDNYPTPAWCVDRLLERVWLPTSGWWLEPSAGDGAIVRRVRARMETSPRIQVVEVRAECEAALRDAIGDRGVVHIGDFLVHEPSHWWSFGGIDVVIGNPPYALAEKFVRRSLMIAPWVVFLLRLNFLAGDKRAGLDGLYAERVPDVYVLPNRPSFAGNGKTDATEYAWFVWGPEKRTTGRLEVLATTPIQERKKGSK